MLYVSCYIFRAYILLLIVPNEFIMKVVLRLKRNYKFPTAGTLKFLIW